MDETQDARDEAPEEPTDAETEGERDKQRPPRPSRRKLLLIVGPIVVLAIAGTTATALTPALAARHPLLLILLEARNRNLILAREVDFVPFLVVATLRRTLTDPLYYLLGYYYGDAAVRWLEVKAGMGSYARMMEAIFRKAAYPAVFFFPGAIVCAMAGVVGMSFPVFIALNLTGTIAAVLALKLFGNTVAAPVEALVAFFDRNLLVTTAISIVLVVLSVVLGRMEGRAEYSMSDLDELEQAAAPEEDADAAAEGSEGER